MKLDPPPHLKPLLDAYIAETGLPVSYTHMRAQALIDLHERGMTPEDVVAVLRELRRRINKGLSGYTENALTFRSAMEDVDRFEDRALQMRKKHRKREPRPDTAQTRPLPDGSTITVLDAQPLADVPPISAECLAQLRQCQEQMKGGQ